MYHPTSLRHIAHDGTRMRKSKGTALTALEIRQALWMRLNRALTCHDLFKDIDRLAKDKVAKFNQHLRFFQTCESALHDATIIATYSLYETPGIASASGN